VSLPPAPLLNDLIVDAPTVVVMDDRVVHALEGIQNGISCLFWLLVAALIGRFVLTLFKR